MVWVDKLSLSILRMNIFHSATKSRGLTTHYNLILQRARMKGFIMYVAVWSSLPARFLLPVWLYSFDHADRFAAAEAYFVELLKDGRLKRKYHVLEGLDKAPTALNMLLTGENRGKMCALVYFQLFFLTIFMMTQGCQSCPKPVVDFEAKVYNWIRLVLNAFISHRILLQDLSCYVLCCASCLISLGHSLQLKACATSSNRFDHILSSRPQLLHGFINHSLLARAC